MCQRTGTFDRTSRAGGVGAGGTVGIGIGMLRAFLLGIVATLMVGAIGGYVVVTTGLVDASAQAKPGGLEKWAAHQSLKAAIARKSVALKDPLPLDDANLSAGLKLYAANCAVCHGAADHQASILAKGFYIGAPLLAKDGVEDDPESETFWKVSNGIRFSAMPAFQKRLTDEQMWQVTQFVAHMDKLPAAVEADWKSVPSAAATPAP